MTSYTISEIGKKLRLSEVQRCGHRIRRMKYPSEELQIIAVNDEPTAIRWLSEPSEKVQLAAVNKGLEAYRHINNPTETVTELYTFKKLMEETCQ